MTIEDLKTKSYLTRTDIAELLSSIGKPGKKRNEKIAAIQALGLSNTQGHDISVTLESYAEF